MIDIKDNLKDFITENCPKYYQSGQSFVFDCPLCNGRKKLYIRKKDGRFICFKCKESNHFSGKAEYALCQLTHVSLKEIQASLYGLIINGKTELDIDLEEIEEDLSEEEFVITTFPLSFYPIDHIFSKDGLEYIYSRGISLELAKKYKLYYSPVDKRVIFPIYNGEYLIGWEGRTIIPDLQPKSKASPGLEKAKLFGFMENLQNSPHALICEGPIDTIKADLCGGAVCTFGKSNITDTQIKLLKNRGIKQVYLALDPDAWRETEAFIKKYTLDFDIKVLEIPDKYKDLGEMPPEEVLECFNNAKPPGPLSLFYSL